MADLRQVRTRLSTAHTATETAAGILSTLMSEYGGRDLSYFQRELHKILGRLEALDAGFAHIQAAAKLPPAKRRRVTRSTIEAEGGKADAPVRD